MWSGMKIVALVVVCLGVSTPLRAQATCSLRLSDSLLSIGACHLGVQKLQEEQQSVNIPNFSIGPSFAVMNIRPSPLKLKSGGCGVRSVAIPPPPTDSGEPPLRNNRRYTVTYQGIQAKATAIWRRGNTWWYSQGDVECTATGSVTIQIDSGIDTANCPVFDNTRCTATVNHVQMTTTNSARLGSYYESALKSAITKQIEYEMKKGCQAAASFLQDAENDPQVMQIFRG